MNRTPLDADIVGSLGDPQNFSKYVGDSRYYRDYTEFFKREIESRGIAEVIDEYMFKGDSRAEDMLGRMFSSKKMSSPDKLGLHSV